ncbi:hypothetical protein QJS10_CPA06g00448 [Acorus calamus]|uniref:N-acetyltransferase domain-containing protein n=1 Tax=Acorus calamus TaxID=4465 RepID=A0AAV9EL59_ACOCL|nr:hypothetical protein QJS10_CPA06g00448 [Acorus calamus]
MADSGKIFPKVTLRMFDPSDADDFMAWAGDARVSRFTREDVFTSRDDALHHIQRTVLPHPWYRAICIDNDDRGAVGSIWVDPGQGAVDGCRGSISYRLAHDYWGRGIATLALKAAVKVVFAEWAHLERVEAIVRVENLGSQRVLEKAGFVREGVLRRYVTHKGKAEDMVMYSILSSEV